MIIKEPVCYDFSHWRTISNFANLDPFPFLVFTKATEGNYQQDSTFIQYFRGMRDNGIHRGAYHFYRNLIDPVVQGRYFCDFVRPHITANDILVLDVEEGGEVASRLKKCLETIQAQFPDNLLMIYSRANILNRIVMTTAEKAFFRQIKIWTAGYPLNPDNFNSPPADYIPDQDRYGEVWTWQYTESGQIGGVLEGSGDCNWLHPSLIQYLGGVVIPPPSGATMKKGILNATTNVLNVRTGIGTSFPIATTLNKINGVSDEAYGELDTASNWLHIQWIIRANGTRVDVDGWCSATYLILTDYTLPTNLPTLNVSLKAAGYPDLNIEWTPNG